MHLSCCLLHALLPETMLHLTMQSLASNLTFSARFAHGGLLYNDVVMHGLKASETAIGQANHQYPGYLSLSTP